jgi:hypothetical protein
MRNRLQALLKPNFISRQQLFGGTTWLVVLSKGLHGKSGHAPGKKRKKISPSQGCQIFLGAWYENWKKCTKWTQNVPNGHKISQIVSIKYYKRPLNKSTFSNLRPWKCFPKLVFLVWKQTIWQPWYKLITFDKKSLQNLSRRFTFGGTLYVPAYKYYKVRIEK